MAESEAELKELVRRLSERLDTVEAELAELRRRSDEDVPEDVLIAISAAVAAYLGHRAKVRAVRFRRTGVWAQQGRSAVQSRTVPHTR
ncbi:hypothetical protein HJ590_17055 [Naumannella sp. ID2617S]|uniref:Uncharacterized protein n=1 Tax=Enemella dayhoffiae TaxID=2016507 RepID=A0A255H9F2_9ACTN|nr:hypothetical protein [Enemella dayhoffiae]NNG21231.1 hypothetical protein [Naumannella sp. ID2617S]OYO24420.1 hypothetical protein CGZ93_03240 [Enemella dayhoffiae]